MALIDLDLISNTNVTLDSSNANNGDTLQLGLVSNGILTVDGVDITLESFVGGAALSSTTINLVTVQT